MLFVIKTVFLQRDKKSKVAELESSLRDAQSQLSDLEQLQVVKQVRVRLSNRCVSDH